MHQLFKKALDELSLIFTYIKWILSSLWLISLELLFTLVGPVCSASAAVLVAYLASALNLRLFFVKCEVDIWPNQEYFFRLDRLWMTKHFTFYDDNGVNPLPSHLHLPQLFCLKSEKKVSPNTFIYLYFRQLHHVSGLAGPGGGGRGRGLRRHTPPE